MSMHLTLMKRILFFAGVLVAIFAVGNIALHYFRTGTNPTTESLSLAVVALAFLKAAELSDTWKI